MKFIDQFRVKPGSDIKLKEIDPDFNKGHKDADEVLLKSKKRLSELQELLYAGRQKSLLIVLQAMDTGGKDGTISHIMDGMNPTGCEVVSFKQPSAEELAHDFLWRIHAAAPARGEITVFNRSHYEDVLVARVHNLVPKEVWKGRYDQINAFENLLVENGTHILKFYLHISKEEQLSRFKARLDDPDKQWKISDYDYKERLFWDDYIAAYEDAISRCSTEGAPWFVIPANHKWFRNVVVARIIVEYLEAMKLKKPMPTVDLDEIRKEYQSARDASDSKDAKTAEDVKKTQDA